MKNRKEKKAMKKIAIVLMMVCLLGGEAFAQSCAELSRGIWRLSAEISDGITAFNRRESMLRIVLQAKRNELSQAFAVACQMEDALQRGMETVEACSQARMDYERAVGEVSRMEEEKRSRENEHIVELAEGVERLEEAFDALNERIARETDPELAWESAGGLGLQYQVRSCIGLLRSQIAAMAGQVTLDSELTAIEKCMDDFTGQMDGAYKTGMLLRQSGALRELAGLLNRIAVAQDAVVDGKELIGTSVLEKGAEEASSL